MAKKQNKPARKKVTKKKSAANRLLDDYFTPKSTPFPQNLEDLSYDQMREVTKAAGNSRVLWDLERLEEAVNNPNYILNKWEQEALDKLFADYHTKYKSKLAETLK